MSDTKWACQVRAVSAIKSRFECLIKFLRHVDSTDGNQEQALVARNVLDQIDQKFIYCMLQSPKLNFLEAADLIESLIEELETYRSEQKSVDYFKKSLAFAKKIN